jgi:hypothetical protein
MSLSQFYAVGAGTGGMAMVGGGSPDMLLAWCAMKPMAEPKPAPPRITVADFICGIHEILEKTHSEEVGHVSRISLG